MVPFSRPARPYSVFEADGPWWTRVVTIQRQVWTYLHHGHVTTRRTEPVTVDVHSVKLVLVKMFVLDEQFRLRGQCRQTRAEAFPGHDFLMTMASGSFHQRCKVNLRA